MIRPNKLRQRLVHSYFDKLSNAQRIFVYNSDHKLVTEMLVYPTGEVKIIWGKLKEDS